jgi:hypothetical protein
MRNNAVAQFKLLHLRDDVGQFWKNFVFSERLKRRSYEGLYGSTYFWRTYQGQEIDCVEEQESKREGDFGLCIVPLFDGPFKRTNSTNMFLQFLFGMPIRFIHRFRRFPEVMEMAQLMGNIWQGRPSGLADRTLPI